MAYKGQSLPTTDSRAPPDFICRGARSAETTVHFKMETVLRINPSSQLTINSSYKTQEGRETSMVVICGQSPKSQWTLTHRISARTCSCQTGRSWNFSSAAMNRISAHHIKRLKREMRNYTDQEQRNRFRHWDLTDAWELIRLRWSDTSADKISRTKIN